MRVSIEELNILDYDLIIFSQRDSRYENLYEIIKLKTDKVFDIWGVLRE
jgi:hypothetical protein